jgi:hypothetical protein
VLLISAYELEHKLKYSNDRTPEYEDHKDRNGYTYPHHLPPVPTTRDNHNPHTTTHYPTMYVHHNPTCTLCHTQQAEPDADELFKLVELSRMYAKWGHKPPKPTALHSTYGGTSDSTTITPAPSPPLHSPTSPFLPPPTPNETPPSTYSYLKALRQDFNDRIPSAVALMWELGDYTWECLHEQEEWSAERRAETRQNHNTTYLKRDYIARPWSWDAVDEPKDGLPRIIEGSRPLCPGLKRRRYRNSRATNSRATYYRTSQLQPPPKPEENKVAPANPPHPSTLHIGGRNDNNADKPTHHINSGTTFYTTFPSRPPPWPNKHPNQD